MCAYFIVVVMYVLHGHGVVEDICINCDAQRTENKFVVCCTLLVNEMRTRLRLASGLAVRALRAGMYTFTRIVMLCTKLCSVFTISSAISVRLSAARTSASHTSTVPQARE